MADDSYSLFRERERFYKERDRINKSQSERELKLKSLNEDLKAARWGRPTQLPEKVPTPVRTNPRNRKLMLD